MSEQLSFTDAGLPRAFADRWRELGGPAVTGDALHYSHGRVYFVVITSRGRFAFPNRADCDVAACADELLAMLVRR